MKEFAVKGSGFSFFVQEDGIDVDGPYASKQSAEAAAERLARKAKVKQRRCMTCQDPFMSEGSHNRMCQRCRTLGASAEMVVV